MGELQRVAQRDGCFAVYGFSFSSLYFSDIGLIVLTPGKFKLEGGLYFSKNNTKRYSGEYSKNLEFKKGDLLIVMTDLIPECNLLGKPAFENVDEPVLHNQRIGKIILKEKYVYLPYLYYIFLSRPYLSRIKETATGSTVRHTANKSIYGVGIPLPPLPEQRAIADALSDVDALLNSLDTLIAKKRLIKQSAMQELLRPKDKWVEKKLRDIAILKARIGWQGLTTAEYRDSGDYYLVTGTDFKGGFIDWDNGHFVADWRYTQDKNIQLREHDVLVTKDGTIGKVALIQQIEKPATLNSGVFVLRPVDEAF